MTDTAAPQPAQKNFWQKLVAFVGGVLMGGTGKLAIPVGVQLPAFKIDADVGIFGRSDVVSLYANGNDDNLNLEVAAQKAPATS